MLPRITALTDLAGDVHVFYSELVQQDHSPRQSVGRDLRRGSRRATPRRQGNLPVQAGHVRGSTGRLYLRQRLGGRDGAGRRRYSAFDCGSGTAGRGLTAFVLKEACPRATIF